MKNRFNGTWGQVCELYTKNFICWNCNGDIVSNRGYTAKESGNDQLIYLCHKCNAPNIFDFYGYKAIEILPGKSIRKLPKNIETIYNEARSCISVGAYTGAVMLFKKNIDEFSCRRRS